MTIKARGTGSLAVSEVNTEAGRAGNEPNTGLKFLNDSIKEGQRAGSPNMDTFYGLAYYQRYMDGNCNDGGANNCNCNCGDRQCVNCNNCTNINCANCDTQAWLQSNCNSPSRPTYNCVSDQNCWSTNCNCSKIICTKLYQIGMMPRKIFEADQAYGDRLRETDPEVYYGYVRWAQIVVDWMDGAGPDFMLWIRDKEIRRTKQQAATIKLAYAIATPWSEHMAYLMGARSTDNNVGRIMMKIGRVLSKVVNKLPKTNFGPLGAYSLWIVCPLLYVTATTVDKIQSMFKNKEVTA